MCATLWLVLGTIFSIALIVAGSFMVQDVPELLQLFGIGMVASLAFKWLVMSPIKTLLYWLVKRNCPQLCVLCPCCLDEGDFVEKDDGTVVVINDDAFDDLDGLSDTAKRTSSNGAELKSCRDSIQVADVVDDASDSDDRNVAKIPSELKIDTTVDE